MKIIEKIIKIYQKDSVTGCYCLDCDRERPLDAPSCKECGSTKRKIFMKCGNIYIDNNKIAITIVIGVVALLGVVAFTKKFSWFSTDTLFWLFSAVLQAFAALIAFLATAIIFRLQNISNEKNLIVERLREVLVYFKSRESYGYTTEEIINIAREIDPNNHPGSSSEVRQVQQLYSRISILEKNAKEVRRSLKESFLNNFIVVLLSLVFLTLTDYIYKYNLDIPAVLIVLLFCFVSLNSAKKMVYLIR